jgi:hypothetical protein
MWGLAITMMPDSGSLVAGTCRLQRQRGGTDGNISLLSVYPQSSLITIANEVLALPTL